MYVTIGLGMLVSENEIYVGDVGVGKRNLCYYRTWDVGVGKRNLCYYSTCHICVGKLHLGPFQGMIQRNGRMHPTYLKKTKSTFKCIAKIHALECKANFIEHYF